mgnify:CR=1 FL=1
MEKSNSITYEEIVCADCAITFQITDTLNKLRKDDGNFFYCPNGHAQSYSDSLTELLNTADSKLEESKKELSEVQIENRRLKCLMLQKPPIEQKHKTLLQRLGLKAS